MIYFDNAATTIKKPESVKRAVYNAFDTIGNPSRGAHEPSLRGSRLVYETRERLAELFGIKDAFRIAFAMNATDALNMAVNSVVNKGDHIITTECEHNSVLRPLYRSGAELTVIKADRQGKIDYNIKTNKNTKAIYINHASNVTGNITDLSKISYHAHKNNILLVVDAAQTAGCINIDAEAMGIDILCFTGHKGLMGPQGTGGIYVRNGIDVKPFRTGGSGIHSFDRAHPSDMPEVLEAGTLNCHGIAGLNAALEFIKNTGVENIYQKESTLADRFINGIRDIRGIRLYGDFTAEKRAPVVTLNIDGIPSDILCDRLWTEYGICTRAGAHCAPMMHKALGTDKSGAVRFSFSYFNTEEEIDQGIKALKEISEL